MRKNQSNYLEQPYIFGQLEKELKQFFLSYVINSVQEETMQKHLKVLELES